MAFRGLPDCPFWFCNVRTKPKDEQDVVARRHSLQMSSACVGCSQPTLAARFPGSTCKDSLDRKIPATWRTRIRCFLPKRQGSSFVAG